MPAYTEHIPMPPPIPYTTSSTPLSDDRRALIGQARSAQLRARKVLPPAVAEVVVNELDAFCELGARMGGADRARRLIAEILAEPVR